MAWTDDFWGVISGGGWAAMSGGGDVQPALTREASQAAWEGKPEGTAPTGGKFADAPVSGSATDDQPVYLGFEDIPGFDPQTDAPFLGHVVNHPGLCTILFPEDPHMPQLITGDQPVEILKAVVKLRVDLVRS